MEPFEGIDIEWARQLLSKRDTTDVQSNRKFFDGDHWQGGDGWVGPRPRTTSGQQDSVREVMNLIERNFVSKNVVREVVERHASATVGREVNWRFVRRDGGDMTEADLAAIRAMEAAVTDWWDNRRLGELLLDALDTALYSDSATLRLFIPSHALDPDRKVPDVDLSGALGLLDAEALGVDVATVFDDPHSGRRIGVYVAEENGRTFAEFSAIDGDGNTIIRRQDEGNALAVDSTPLVLGGRLPLVLLERARIVSPQVRQNQRLVNMAVTMMSRNIVLAGFLERTIVNAEMPGHYEVGEDGRKVFHPDPLEVGAGAVNLLQSTLVEDAQGRASALPTSIVYRDPVSVVTFTDTKHDAQENIYDEVKQRHVLIAGDATASGVSRQQAMADFESDLNRTKMAVDRCVQTLLETVVAFGTYLSNVEVDFLDRFKAVADTRIQLTPPTVEEQNMAMALRDAELISSETAMGRVGIEDPVAEKQKIRQEIDDDIDGGRARAPSPSALANLPTSALLDTLRRAEAASRETPS